MFEDDKSYFQHRAAIEIERARRAEGPEAQRIHHELAQAYAGRVAATGTIANGRAT